jgi:hypothetical protein
MKMDFEGVKQLLDTSGAAVFGELGFELSLCMCSTLHHI